MSLRLQYLGVTSSYVGGQIWSASLPHFIFRVYLKNGMMDKLQIWHVHVIGPQDVPYCKVILNSQYNIFISRLRFSISRQYLKNGLMNSIQIWHVVVTGFQGVRYFKVTLNAH